MRWLHARLRRTAVKIGMVAGASIAAAIVSGLEAWQGPVVFDPVLGASGGGSLFEGAPADLLPLVRRATLVTPNLAEAAWLTGLAVETLDHARHAAQVLAGLGSRPPFWSREVTCPGQRPTCFVPRQANGYSRGRGCRAETHAGPAVRSPRPLRWGWLGASHLNRLLTPPRSWLAGRIQAAVTVGNSRYLNQATR